MNFIYFYYIKELKYKFYYNLGLLFFLFITCILYNNTLTFLLAKQFLNSIDSPKFFFSNIMELFVWQIQISIAVSLVIGIPFLFFNFLMYFVPSLYFNEYFKVLFSSIFYCFYYISFICLFNNFFFFNFISFFFKFSQENNYLPIFFEALPSGEGWVGLNRHKTLCLYVFTGQCVKRCR